MSKRSFWWYPMAACVAVLPLAAANAQDTGFSNITLSAQQASNAGHGSVSIGYSRPFYHGDYGGPAGINSGQVQFQVITLSASYFISDHWEVRASLPFVRGKSDGLQQHMQLPCPPPEGTLAQCAPVRVDDGQYHGTWADWDFGLGYYTMIGDNYYVTPTFDVYIPSHNYAYYGAAIVGERVAHYGIGVQLQHQFDFSNFYYTVVYQYVVKPVILGFNSNYSELAIDLGYFVNPKLGVRFITDTKVGSGLDDAELNGSIGTPEGPDFNQGTLWPIHDKIRKQDHINVGFAVDYALGAHNELTFAALRSVWGKSNARLQNGISLTLIHGF